MRFHRPSPALTVAFLALLVALGGVAVAAVPARDGDVHLCYSKRTGAVEVVDTQNDRFRCDRNWRGFSIPTKPQSLTSPDGKSTVTVGDRGVVTMTSPSGSVRIGEKTVNVNAPDEINLATGSASIQMKKNGDITIKGKDIALEGTGQVQVKASGDVTVKGSKVGGN